MTPTKPNRAITIASFGEALWDVLPRGIFLGGAPLNVAYHLSRLGAKPLLVSAVGRDFLGDEVLRRLKTWKLDARFVAPLARQATGTVLANVDARGVATYRITTDVAWDRIPVPPALLRRTQPPAALLFGTLAMRSTSNRQAFSRLVQAWPDTWRVLDLNLRAPFDRGPAIAFALRHANMVKLNDDELARLMAARVDSPARIEQAARALARRHQVERVCVTAGARGAGLLWDDGWSWEQGRPVVVRDTVGAGDAFLGGLLAALLVRGEAPKQALAQACRLGEFVASRDGATPPYQVDARGRPSDRSSS